MLKQRETRRKFRNHRNDHNYLLQCQAAIAVEDSMVNDKTHQHVEAETMFKPGKQQHEISHPKYFLS